MIHIKRFNEAVIDPSDFSEVLNKLRSVDNIDLIELNTMFSHLNVEFVNIDDFISTLRTQKEIDLVPSHLDLGMGVRFAAPNQHTGKVYICIHEDKFIDSLNGPNRLNLITFLDEILRHESIHLGQFSRRPNFKQNFLEKSPKSAEEYFSTPEEIMAYADSFIFKCRNAGMTDDEILDAITTGKKTNWIHDRTYGDVQKHYPELKNLDPKVRNRFKTYVYQYLRGKK